ncbi:MAG: BamA/TamA family outer membrane protein [Pseudomonadota bacterium]
MRGIGIVAVSALAFHGHSAFAQGKSEPAQQTHKETDKDAPDTQEKPALEDEIVSDEAFQSSLPELSADDDELGEALEPIEAFERRFEAQSSAANPDPDESNERDPDPAAESVPQAEKPLGMPRFKDPDLAEPLSPLEELEALPLDFTPASSGGDTENAELRYRWEISGLADADAQTGVDLEDQFETLSALEQGDGKAANTAMLSARLAEDTALLTRILHAEGWYLAEVRGRLGPGQTEDKVAAIASLTVEAGPRFTLSQIVIEAAPTTPDDLIESAISLEPGDPVTATAIQFNEALIAKTLPENGYPFATVGPRDIALNAETAGSVYTLPVDTGPRARIGGFATGEGAVFDAEHIADIARFTRGDLFDSRNLNDLRRALAATGLLRSFSVEPEVTDQNADDGTQYVTIQVDQTAGPPRTLAGSLGYGTGQGVRLEGSWAHRNLFPPEGALTASVIAGTLEQGATLAFRRANAGARDHTFDLGVSALRSNFEAFEAVTGRVGATYSYVSTPIWQKRITYAFGAEAIASVETAFDVQARDFIDQTYFIGAVFGQVGFDTSDDLLNPTRGFRLEGLVQPEGSFEGSFTPYARIVLDATGYMPAGDALVLAGRARFGTLQGADGVDIAPSRRLYAGGGGSVRGFGFQQLGPRAIAPNENFDPDDPDETDDPFTLEPIGGRSVIEASAEARYRFGDYGVVAFVDAGQVYTDTIPTFEDIRFGVGLGARVYTSFGPIRVDVGTPINPRQGESRINVYVSIGQAF